MKFLPMTLLVAAVALSACTNPNRFGGDDALANPVPSTARR